MNSELGAHFNTPSPPLRHLSRCRPLPVRPRPRPPPLPLRAAAAPPSAVGSPRRWTGSACAAARARPPPSSSRRACPRPHLTRTPILFDVTCSPHPSSSSPPPAAPPRPARFGGAGALEVEPPPPPPPPRNQVALPPVRPPPPPPDALGRAPVARPRAVPLSELAAGRQLVSWLAPSQRACALCQKPYEGAVSHPPQNAPQDATLTADAAAHGSGSPHAVGGARAGRPRPGLRQAARRPRHRAQVPRAVARHRRRRGSVPAVRVGRCRRRLRYAGVPAPLRPPPAASRGSSFFDLNPHNTWPFRSL